MQFARPRRSGGLCVLCLGLPNESESPTSWAAASGVLPPCEVSLCALPCVLRGQREVTDTEQTPPPSYLPTIYCLVAAQPPTDSAPSQLAAARRNVPWVGKPACLHTSPLARPPFPGLSGCSCWAGQGLCFFPQSVRGQPRNREIPAPWLSLLGQPPCLPLFANPCLPGHGDAQLSRQGWLRTSGSQV